MRVQAPPIAKGVKLEAERAPAPRGGGAVGNAKSPAMLEAVLNALLADEPSLTPATRAAAVQVRRLTACMT
jgi:hypothetical protein